MAQQVDDDVGRLVGNIGRVRGWQSSQTGINWKNARILRKNLGITQGGRAAHHIVPGLDLSAAEARALLDHYQIDINSGVNGVDLTIQQHQTLGLHTDDAIEAVTERLNAAVKGIKDWANSLLNLSGFPFVAVLGAGQRVVLHAIPK